MARAQETGEQQGMKIAQLCRESGLTRSTIHHYVNIGLLHRPREVGLNLHLFDESHLSRLRQIRQLRENEDLPLAEIKKLLDRVQSPESPRSTSETTRQGLPEVRSPDGAAEAVLGNQARRNREKILDAAITLFSERGYENTKISDITDTLHMGKGTFYVYFNNKKELFMECIDRLTVTIVPREAWDEIRREEDLDRRTWKRGVAFLNAFPGFRGILNMLRIALGGSDPALAEKAKEAFRVLSAPMAKDLRRGISSGLVRSDLDVEFVAYLELVLGEALGYWSLMDPRYSIERGMDLLIDYFAPSLVQEGREEEVRQGRQAHSGELTDRNGGSTQLKDIHVVGRPYLTGKIGEAEVDLDFAKTSTVKFSQKGSVWLAEAIIKDGDRVVLEVDGEMNVSGKASFGSFHIPLKGVASISFGKP
jgi:AcrR family transcriptional regulator